MVGIFRLAVTSLNDRPCRNPASLVPRLLQTPSVQEFPTYAMQVAPTGKEKQVAHHLPPVFYITAPLLTDAVLSVTQQVPDHILLPYQTF